MDHKINSVELAPFLRGVVLYLKMIYRISWETPMGYRISRYPTAPGSAGGYLRKTPSELKESYKQS